HTLNHFESAFFSPELFDNNSIEQWEAEGSKEITRRALDYAKKLLAEYEQPPLDPSVDESLLEYIRRRETEIPASDELNQSY
ncbi:MAG: trimethylamine methyltransferase family protein, partial [Polyangiales bacterium]